ncbi:MAG: VWA domain-containing protein [Acidobacteriota bacterium]
MRGVATVFVLALATVSALQPEPRPAPPSGQPQPAPPAQTADPAGQEPVQPVFRAGVDLVRVDVSVIGRGDEPVRDLTAEDFEVKEDGVLQTVETVQFVEITGERTSDLNEGLEIRSPEHGRLEARREDVRLFAIFIDDYHIDKAPLTNEKVKTIVRAFVESLGPNDLVILMDPLTPLTHLEFTRSKPDILERIRTFEGRRNQIFPVKSLIEEAQLTQRNVWELRAGVTIDAITAIATHLGGLREGRKSVVLISQGPPVTIGSTNDQRLREAVNAANRGNVQINVVDPRALGQAPFGGSYSLRRLADETGGRAIIGSNEPERHLGDIVADASAYYLVGYTPTRAAQNDGKFHDIDVRVKRPGVRVRARKGYWAPSEAELTAAARTAPVVDGVREALEELARPRSGRPVDLWIGTSRADHGRSAVEFTWEPTGRAGRDRPVTLQVQPVIPGPEDTPLADVQAIDGRPIGAPGPSVARFDLPPGDVVFRLTALAASGDVVDRWTESVTIPAFPADVLAFATPRVLRARSPYEARALEKDPSPTPVAARAFRPSDRMFVETELYAPADAQPTLAAHLLSAEGQHLLDLTVPAANTGSPFRIAVPLSSLAPGTFLVRLEATSGERTSRQILAFRVSP